MCMAKVLFVVLDSALLAFLLALLCSSTGRVFTRRVGGITHGRVLWSGCECLW